MLGEKVWDLPPLILHPFNEHVAPCALLENSKAALMLSGLIPNDGTDRDELKKRLLSGRYAEIRMLYYLGKDVFRWIEQCGEWASRVPELESLEIHRQSFAGLLTANPPPSVREKLVRWGVLDYVSIFSRSIGLNALFAQPPAFEQLAEDFLRNYHRYADTLYRCFAESQPHGDLDATNFHFELYASGEYSRMLENEWAGG
ncbi:MAG TPA: hypothetical protein VNY05_30610 [Candidatus Acidoferrales bacterium]|jgi:hypothetical protein|nr:hypothetical protein [Candidatus Acidoferrales bacterium]